MSALSKINSRASLDRSPKKNHVERAGGLPMYIRRIANHLHQEKGMKIGHAIATAKNAAAKMCATGDLNFPGKQQVNPGSQAEACASVADWNRRIAKTRVEKGIITGRKMTDDEYIEILVEDEIVKSEIHKGCGCGKNRRKKKKVEKAFDPNQPRDKDGQWTDGTHTSILGAPIAAPGTKRRQRQLDRQGVAADAPARKVSSNPATNAPIGSGVQISSRLFVKRGNDKWSEDWEGSPTRNDASIQRELKKAQKSGVTISWKSKPKKSKRLSDSDFRGPSPSKADVAALRNRKRNVIKLSDEEIEKIEKELDLDFNADVNADAEEFLVTGEIEKRDDEKQLVFGWCSIAKRADGTVVVDKQGDVLEDIDQMEKVAYDFVLHSRDGGEMHVRKGVSTMVESFVSTPEKLEALGIPEGTLPVGWWVGFKVTDKGVWEQVKKGKYKMFSVHGSGTRKAYEGDE
jgi:hypothetical protein